MAQSHDPWMKLIPSSPEFAWVRENGLEVTLTSGGLLPKST
jgi:hypothetical protein